MRLIIGKFIKKNTWGLGTPQRVNIGVFASGRGSNFSAILQAIDEGRLNVSVGALISNNAGSRALETARARNIPAYHIPVSSFRTEQEHEAALSEILGRHGIDFIVLAGYLKKIPAAIVREFRNRILNIHPALLPSFSGKSMYGIHVHEAVLAAGVKVTGVTVHLVDEEYDHGPIVLQRAVDVHDDDNAETLAARVLEIEHALYPEALCLFADGRIQIKNGVAIRTGKT